MDKGSLMGPLVLSWVGLPLSRHYPSHVETLKTRLSISFDLLSPGVTLPLLTVPSYLCPIQNFCSSLEFWAGLRILRHVLLALGLLLASTLLGGGAEGHRVCVYHCL